MGDWFRRERWTSEDEEDFFARLERARPTLRGQYLRIQALHLEAGEEWEAALSLLDLVLKEYPDPTEVPAAHHQRARCLDRLGRFDEAVEAYRRSFASMRSGGQGRVHAYLDFARRVLERGRTDLYDEALNTLDEFSGDLSLPADVYAFAAAKALILGRTGRTGEAKVCARRALAESRKEHSGLRYHPGLGVVSDPDGSTIDELERLAE